MLYGRSIFVRRNRMRARERKRGKKDPGQKCQAYRWVRAQTPPGYALASPCANKIIEENIPSLAAYVSRQTGLGENSIWTPFRLAGDASLKLSTLFPDTCPEISMRETSQLYANKMIKEMCEIFSRLRSAA